MKHLFNILTTWFYKKSLDGKMIKFVTIYFILSVGIGFPLLLGNLWESNPNLHTFAENVLQYKFAPLLPYQTDDSLYADMLIGISAVEWSQMHQYDSTISYWILRVFEGIIITYGFLLFEGIVIAHFFRRVLKWDGKTWLGHVPFVILYIGVIGDLFENVSDTILQLAGGGLGTAQTLLIFKTVGSLVKTCTSLYIIVPIGIVCSLGSLIYALKQRHKKP